MIELRSGGVTFFRDLRETRSQFTLYRRLNEEKRKVEEKEEKSLIAFIPRTYI